MDYSIYELARIFFKKNLEDLSEKELGSVLGMHYPYQDPMTIKSWAKERIKKFGRSARTNSWWFLS